MFKVESGANYYFHQSKILEYFNKLPETDFVSSRIYANFKEIDRIAVVTIDDFWDQETESLIQKSKVPATLFSLVPRVQIGSLRTMDLGIHFNKDDGAPLAYQIKEFETRVGFVPLWNRNHRMWWRSDNLDLLYLAANGIEVDSTLAGTLPYLQVIEGRVIPIWEVPYSVYELTMKETRKIHAAYQATRNFHLLFDKGVPLIVGCFHPLSLQEKYEFRSLLRNFIEYGKEKKYRFMSIRELFEEILLSQREEICGT